MFIYYSRLYEFYPEQVVSMAILADEEPGWEPKEYEHDLVDTEVSFRYHTVKLWEYNDRWEELAADPNPCALVVMAHLKTKATRGNAQERLRWKIELVQMLYERDEVWELFRFIDWVLALPEEVDRTFRKTVDEIEQESNMKYVTSIERMSREEGHEEGLRDMLLTLVEESYGPPEASIRKLIEQASRDQLLLWAKRLFMASSLDEVFAT